MRRSGSPVGLRTRLGESMQRQVLLASPPRRVGSHPINQRRRACVARLRVYIPLSEVLHTTPAFAKAGCAQGFQPCLRSPWWASRAGRPTHHCPARAGLPCGPSLRSGKCLLRARAAHHHPHRQAGSGWLSERTCPTAGRGRGCTPPDCGTGAGAPLG